MSLTPSTQPIPALAVANESDFRGWVRAWITENLPAPWMDRSFGASDEALIEQRLVFGRRLGRAGLLSLVWPEEVGGAGLPASRRIILLEELIRAGAPEPMNANALGIFAPTLIRFGTTEQCGRLLPAMLEHDEIWCQGFSEPGAGSDLAAISTRGEFDGDNLVITGQKVWTSFAELADYCYLLVRTANGGRRHDGISLVVLPMHQPGVVVRPLRNMVGTNEFCEVFLDQARVPIGNIVGSLGSGWAMAMYALGQERSVGLAQRALKLDGEFKKLAHLAFNEHDCGNPRVTEGFLERDLVDAYVRATVVSATVRRAIQLDGEGVDIGPISSVAKIFWSESHQTQMDVASELMGPDFVIDEQPASDWYRASLFARAETIYGGTSQIQRNLVARALGLPKGQ